MGVGAGLGGDEPRVAHGGDGLADRTRRIDLTDRGRSLVPFLEAEWRATHSTVAELDSEVPYAMTAVVEEVRRALERRSMRQRILHHLTEPPR
ncbi:hypothetical protein HFP69_36395 [Streptomyces sp. ARC12]|uniref:hypothetical protein n=1 Tax=Streptomyces TaxID=1883 RepID=UPI0037A6DABE